MALVNINCNLNMLMGGTPKINRYIIGGYGSSPGQNLTYCDDGINWTNLSGNALGKPVCGTEIQTIVYFNNLFVQCGTGINSVGYSKDGIYWTITSNGDTNNIFSYCFTACYGNGIWVFGGNGNNTLAYSTDDCHTLVGLGKTILSNACHKIFFDGTKFWACGDGTSHNLAWSTDGINWTGQGKTIFQNVIFDGLYHDGIYLLAGWGTARSIRRSTNGTSWTTVEANSIWGECISIAYSPVLNRYIAGSDVGSNRLAYSNDGITWNGLGTSLFSTECKGVFWAKDKFIASGRGTNNIAYSEDGINWNGLGASVFLQGRKAGVYANINEDIVVDPTWWGIGDSVMWGYGSFNVSGWFFVLNRLKQFSPRNLSVSGQETSQFISTQLPLIRQKKSQDKYVFINGGINDCIAGRVKSTFKNNVKALIDGCIAKGYDNTNIVVGNVYYFTAYGGGSLAIVLSYNDAVSELWDEYNMTYRPDVYPIIQADPATYLGADNIHPTPAGHIAVANYYNSILP